MAKVSGNGWPVLSDRADQRAHLVTIEPVPGRKFRVRREAAHVFEWFIAEFHKSVERIDEGVLDDWSFAVRPVRGGSTPSNHASGTAVDLNAVDHPLGARKTFTAAQVAVIQELIEKCGRAIRWGGEYSRRKDEMHFEVRPGFSPAKIKNITVEGISMEQYKPGERTIELGSRGPDVAYVQTIVQIAPKDIDGVFGPQTAEAVKRFQRERGLDADAIVGPKTWAPLLEGTERGIVTLDAACHKIVNHFGTNPSQLTSINMQVVRLDLMKELVKGIKTDG